MGDVGFRVLIGGRMGRRPRFAMELPETVHPSDLAQVIVSVLEQLVRHAGGGKSFSEIAEKVGTIRMDKGIKQRVGGRKT